ncbi:MAG TPA: hypothetical protein VGM63_18960 [Mucilaginibacter sp.]|jgi:hypothetical protein
MQPTVQKNTNTTWTTWQKIAFRFFFIFISLQTVTEVFWGNLFGDTLVIWRLGEKIFVPACLWLNQHIFHFTYRQQTWTTFSGSLHTIRDIMYLAVACLGCVVWTITDRKRTSYNKLLYWFSQWLIMLLACIGFAYGIVKIFPVQMNSLSVIDLYKPVGELSPFNLLWATFGYGKPYQVFTGIFEASGAILVLFKRTRLAGLLIMTAVMLNVIMLNYTFQVGVLTLSFYIFLVCLFLLSAYTRRLSGILLADKQVILPQNEYIPDKKSKLRWLRIPMLLFIAFSFVADSNHAYNWYSTRALANKSRKYSMVRNYVINNDTLPLIENDSIRWRIWSERVNEGKRQVTITTMNPAVYRTYTIQQDSLLNSLTLLPLYSNDTIPLKFCYTQVDNHDWCLEGVVNQKKVKVNLHRTDPDTLLNLLKTKRTIITFDDESDHQ